MVEGEAVNQQIAHQGIKADTTLPTNSIGTPQDNINITSGTVAGVNLFHSFEQLNVEAGQTVNFISPSKDIQNILIRVTGGSCSEIRGTLASSGLSNANLFLINSSGIIFGDYASLSVGASFVATTADAIQFGDNDFFSASAPNDSALPSVNPSAFLFKQVPAQSITNQSYTGLQVNTGQSLLLVGGDVFLIPVEPSQKIYESIQVKSLQASDGRIELGGLAEAGAVGLNVNGNSLSLSFPDRVARANVLLISASVNVAGKGSGSIAINADDLDILKGSYLLAGIIGSGSVDSKAGNITLNVTGRTRIIESSVANDIGPKAVSNGGNIDINAMSISLARRAELRTRTRGEGDAGSVLLEAKGPTSLIRSSIFSNTFGKGNSGNIYINAETFLLENNASLNTSTFTEGDAGSVFVKARKVSIADSFIFAIAEPKIVTPEKVGNSGNISIDSQELSLTDGSQLFDSKFQERNAEDTC